MNHGAEFVTNCGMKCGKCGAALLFCCSVAWICSPSKTKKVYFRAHGLT